MDCLIADAVVAPEELATADLYSERTVVRMPYSFTAAGYAGHQQVDDSPAIGGRRGLGLPESAFVMCSFNRLEKLDPGTFALWLQITLRIPHSVLWIYEPDGDSKPLYDADGGAPNHPSHSHSHQRAQLLANAAAAGVPMGRIIFAGKLPKAQHLGRLRRADVFLDGAHYSAHTIAADALWAGLPVLTCPQAAFASRVSASMAIAAGAALLPLPPASSSPYASAAAGASGASGAAAAAGAGSGLPSPQGSLSPTAREAVHVGRVHHHEPDDEAAGKGAAGKGGAGEISSSMEAGSGRAALIAAQRSPTSIRRQIDMVAASWKEYADSAADMGRACHAARAAEGPGLSAGTGQGAEGSAEERERERAREPSGYPYESDGVHGVYSAHIRMQQATHPLFDTASLVRGLEEVLGGLVRSREGGGA